MREGLKGRSCRENLKAELGPFRKAGKAVFEQGLYTPTISESSYRGIFSQSSLAIFVAALPLAFELFFVSSKALLPTSTDPELPK